MASSVVFPVEQNDASSSHQTPEVHHRPPHLPFRRISLPSVPNSAENRQSIVSFASFDSTPEEGQRSSLPALVTSVAKQENVQARPHLHQRPSSRLRTKSSNRYNDATNAALKQRRRKVVNEIFETERAYVNGLDLIYTKFLMPLISSLDTPQPLLGRHELTSIFSNFIDIWNFHRSFFTSLTTLLSDASDPPPPLSSVLMSHFPYLSLYTLFVTSFPTVLTSLSSLISNNPAFSNFVRTQEADPRCGKLGLRDWLLTIVQRCPRYLLLLKDLINCTDPSDPEHGSLTAVHALLSKITNSLNVSLETHSQILSLLALQRATLNLPFKLVTPGRSLLRRGSLLQGQVEHNAPDAREFLLFSDCLVWLARGDDRKEWSVAEHRLRRPRLHRDRSKSETQLPTTASPMMERSGNSDERWTFKGKAELVDLEVVVNPTGRDETDRTRFDILSPEVSFAVYAATAEERDQWMTAIRNAKSSLLVSLNVMHPNSTLTSSEATTHLRRALQALPHPSDDGTNTRRGRVDHFLPAVWVPDAKTDSCMRCGARFGWRRRRHHCRLCGRCVCANCSGKTFFISDVNTKESKPARACNTCYDTVFPVLTSPSTTSTLTAQPQGESHNTNTSTLGTLSQLPSWKSMPSFSPPGQSDPGSMSPSALFKPPPSAFHRLRRPRISPRPQSQPVMNLTMSRMTSATTSTVSVDMISPSDDSVELSAPSAAGSTNAGAENGNSNSNNEHRDRLRESIEARAEPNRFSLAALAVNTAAVTARPTSVGEGRSKRFSLLLGGRNMMQRKTQTRQVDQEQAGDLEHGVAASKLSEILGREREH